ncbi:MAG TPA: hypothetical protein PLV83_03505 [Bacilli bacterium]|nr:hypothetical protein [Bacilli bacterium]
MKLFKRKKEEKRINRKVVIIIEVFAALFLFATLLGIKWLVTNGNSESNIVKLENQEVSNISFVDFKVEYTKNKGNVTVSAINYKDQPVTINNLKIKLYAADNSLISQIEVADQVNLESNQEQLITSTIATTTKVASVEYVIE